MNFKKFIMRKIFQKKHIKNDEITEQRHQHKSFDNIIDFSIEENRMKSFEKWTGFIHKNFLVKNGFFYLGYNDSVKCYSCGLQLEDWNINDNPDYIHRLLSNNCNHIAKCDVISDQYIRCVICIDNLKEICLLPCAHLLLCEKCSETIYEECPLCKSKICQKIKVFI